MSISIIKFHVMDRLTNKKEEPNEKKIVWMFEHWKHHKYENRAEYNNTKV